VLQKFLEREKNTIIIFRDRFPNSFYFYRYDGNKREANLMVPLVLVHLHLFTKLSQSGLNIVYRMPYLDA
jgi:hypothetical protein